MKTAIVLCLDSYYVEPAAVFLESFADNYHYRKDIDIVCVMPEADAEGFEKLKSLVNLDLRFVLHLVSVPDSAYPWMQNLFVESKPIRPTVWYRLFLGSLLKDYDRAIYFDPDILIVNDVQPILDHPMRSNFLATYDTVGVPYLYNLHSGHMAHFVTGVLMMNLNWWRDSGIEDKFREDIETNGPHDLLDEYLMNKYLKDEWYPLPLSFNFHSFETDAHGVPNWDVSYLPMHFYRHAIVFHFAGPLKPWNYEETLKVRDKSVLGGEWRRRRTLIGTKRKPRSLI